jgi:hypothetical protein
MLEPANMLTLQSRHPGIEYRDLLDILEKLQVEGLVQAERVANLAGKGTPYYGALKAEWLKAEGLEHRAMILMMSEALVHLRPMPYMQTLGSNYPDLGLELAKPKTAIEAETGRKKKTPEDLDKWAADTKSRNIKLEYTRTVVVVPNERVLKRYEEACNKHELELVTMANLLKHLNIEPKQDDKALEETDE